MATFQYSLTLLLLLLISHRSIQEPEQPPTLSTVDLNSLFLIKNSLTDLPGSNFFSTWNFTTPNNPCSTFAGISCSFFPTSNTLRVTTLSLGTGLSGSLGLGGSLPVSISQLTELTQLILNPGLVTGLVPPQLGRLTNLRVLSLAHNRLTGPIPSTVSALRELHTLDLGFNQLTGPIPPSLLTELTQLKVLILAGNRLTGELPASTGSTQLLHMDLKSNQLVGPIPPSLPLTLRYVSLSENSMWGPINGLESLSELVYLDLSVNQFSGSLPNSLLRPSLSSLLLHRNNFSGEFSGTPESMAYCEGSIVDLSHNGFSGKLPDVFAGAESVFLNNNLFSGPISEAYVTSLMEGRTKTLYLQHNFLDRFSKHLEILPDEVEICLAYNCMVPPVGLDTCPASAGDLLSRPAEQCSVFHNN